MRKRSDVVPGATPSMFDSDKEESPVKEDTRLDLELDFSAMCIALKERDYAVGVSEVAYWAPQVRHVVAMWLRGHLAEGEIPEAVKSLKKAPPPLPPASPSRKEEEPRPPVSDPVAVARVLRASALEKARTEAESVELVAGELLAPPDTVTVTWGSEKFYPVAKSYNNFEVGMLSTTVHLRPGQGRVEAARAAYADLAVLGEEFREQKRVSFLRSLKRMLADEKSEKGE